MPLNDIENGKDGITTATRAYIPLSDAQHRSELRKAVIAATVGTTIEWYGFFVCGTAAGLVFGERYFPNQDAITATLAAFDTHFHRLYRPANRGGRFGHYGDRIGRRRR
jgi:hypothetical protein